MVKRLSDAKCVVGDLVLALQEERVDYRGFIVVLMLDLGVSGPGRSGVSGPGRSEIPTNAAGRGHVGSLGNLKSLN